MPIRSRKRYHPPRMTRSGRIFSTAAAGLILIVLVSCGSDKTIPSSLAGDRDLAEMLAIARDPGSDAAQRYAALEPVISRYRDTGETYRLNSLLGEFLEKHPDDPYGAYYLMAMAEGARESGSQDLALDYFRRLLKNYPDLEMTDRSLHLLAMGEIAKNSADPSEAAAMRLRMQREYGDRIDPGRNLYALAEDYRAMGDWDGMYSAWQEYMSYPETVIPGLPDARSRVRTSLEFHESSKNWTMESLDDLVGTIKYAIRTQNRQLLTQYQADRFFVMNWSQRDSDDFVYKPMNLGSFLKNSVRYSGELADFSNDREAYLWTAGWSWKIPTWYLYFRKIDYPADPEINGRWEWAGIYFGERL